MKTRYLAVGRGSCRLAVVAVAGIAFACGGPVRLQPAATALQAREIEDAVLGRDRGVEVIAQAGDFPGNVPIEEEVTPLRVMIRNRSEGPLQVRYSAFRLTLPGGVEFHAIPPTEVSGVVELTSPGLQPGFGYADFYTAPYYGRYFTGIEPYAGPFAYDGAYYSTYRPYWEMTAVLPTDDMLERALPEGVIDVGGSVDGYLYFEKVNADEGTTVTLKVELRSASDHEVVTRLSLPFVVD